MTTYTLRRTAVAPPSAPPLDPAQQAVVDHAGGPLLVLAGPGTGKTTTLVEAVVDLVERRGVPPEQVLALTFSRKAAEQLRDRVTARLGRTLATPVSSTFHSFAYALVRQYTPTDLYADPLRLLSAPEQDVKLAELLTDAPEAVRWPDSFQSAVGTRGFAREVHALMAQARERGLEPGDLVALGRDEAMPELEAAGRFMGQYLDVLGDESAIDYPDLVARAVLEAEAHRDELRARFTHVFVDEYQDTDPSQVRLLRALAGDGRNLVVVGDPDQSIYAFRGADVRGILEFPRAFTRADGELAPVVALGTTRRFGSRLLRASRSVASSLGVSGAITAEQWEAFRTPVAAAGPFGPGAVDVLTFDTARAETEHIADLLRRAHLEEGVAWSEMAVLVRSGRGSIPALRRSLAGAGVPVEVARDDTPLVREPGVLPLLGALRVVLDADVEDPTHPDHVGPDRVEELLTSPLGTLDATDVRALARTLRARQRAEGGDLGSSALVRRAVLEPGFLDGVEGEPAQRARRLAALLLGARERLVDGGTAEEVLWVLWAGTDWGERLRAATQRGGAGARLAHRDLDALCALFETAARSEEQRGHTSVTSFLDTLSAQEIPGDTLADQGVRGDAVRLLTAHRAKGLEWRLVVVAHVQERAWPDLRRRGSLLQADRIGPDGLLPPLTTAAMLAEERRLFYVAATRARQRLVVTAVQSPDDEGEQPSRFLTELGRQVEHRQGRPRRPLSLAGLVAELRRTAADPQEPSTLRRAAARRLALLARTEVHGRPVAPAADPASWWGMRAPSRAARPVRPEDQPVTLSASALEGLLRCPAQWFLSREAGGQVVSTASQGFGTVVHALAERIATGELTPSSVEDDLMPLVDEVWGRMEFRTPWSRSREREQAALALARFVAWHGSPGARTFVSTETRLRAEVTLPDGQRVRIDGDADRLELDEAGRVVVVDLKTGKYAPTGPQVVEHPQLGLYALAVTHGAADEVLGRAAESGGAELVHLRLGDATPKVQRQDPQVPGPDGARLVERQLMEAAATVRDERFVARPGAHCERCDFHAVCPTKASGSVLS